MKHLFFYFSKSRKLQLIIIIVLTILIQSNVLYNKFAVDDGVAYLNNAYIKKGVFGWKEALTRPYFEGQRLEENGTINNITDLPGDRWRPLLLLSFALEREFFGTNPLGGHIISLILLVSNIICIYYFLINFVFITKNELSSFWATLLFALLPIHAEVIANIKSQDEMFCLLFGMLSLIYGIKYVKGGISELFLCLLFYMISLFYKESALMFFIMIPISMYYFTKGNYKKPISVFFILFSGFAFYLYLRFQVTGINFEASKALYNDPYLLADFEAKWCTILYVCVYNLGLLIYPIKYAWDYQYCVFPYLSITDTKFIFSLLLVIILATIVILGISKKNKMSYAILFFGANFILVNNMLINLGSYLDERCLYMPSIGYVIFAIYILKYLFNKIVKFSSIRFGVVLYLILLLPYSYFGIKKLRKRNAEWFDSSTLIIDTYNFPTNGKLQNTMAESFLSKTTFEIERSKTMNKQAHSYIDSANYYLIKSLEIYPDDKEIQSDIAMTYDLVHSDKDSLHNTQIRNGVYYSPRSKEIANIYLVRAKLAYINNQLKSADSLLSKAYYINPADEDIAYNYGLVAYHNKKYELALKLVEFALLKKENEFKINQLHQAILIKQDSILHPDENSKIEKKIKNIKNGIITN